MLTSNTKPSTHPGHFYLWKETAVSAGATVMSSSDGTTYNSSGDQITSESAWGNSFAWVRIRFPDGKEFTVQKGSTSNNRDWRIKFHPSNAFTGGSPSATQTPSATNEVLLIGGGTDASPTFGQLFTGTEGAYNNLVIQQESTDGGGHYGFVMVSYADASWPTTIFALDPMRAGSYPPGDTAPFVYGAVFNVTAGLSVSQFVGSSQAKHYDAVADVQQSIVGDTNVFPTGLSATNYFNSKHDISDITWWNSSGSNFAGIKGVGELIRMIGYSVTNPGSTLQVATARDRAMVYTGYHIPWDGNALLNAHGSATNETAQRLIDDDEPPTPDPPDTTPPAVTNLSPTAGSNINADTEIEFDVTDAAGLALVVVAVSFASGTTEIVHDGDGFRGAYYGVRSAITNGYHFRFKRSGGGWPSAPTIEIFAIDTSGNLATN